MRYTNRQCREQARRKNVFQNNNGTIYSRWCGEVYAVFSYGEHFPMFVWCERMWFENGDGYSRTTAKQKGQVRPSHNTKSLTTRQMKALTEHGLSGLVKLRLEGEKI